MINLSELLVFVITTKDFKIRQDNIRNQACEYGFTPNFIFSYDKQDITEEDKKRVHRALPLGATSAVLKHIEAQRLLVNSEKQYALVLEDDALLSKKFPILMSELKLEDVPQPFLLFIGGADNYLPNVNPTSFNKRLIRYPMSTAEAYIIEKEGCIKRLKWLDQNIIAKPADHLLTELDATLGITHYRLIDPVASQGSITGRFATTLDGNRGKHSKGYLLLRYLYNRLRRHKIPYTTRNIRNWFIRLIEGGR